MYTFRVRGRGAFPVDMLRYDTCWPASGASASLLAESLTSVHLRTAENPLREIILASESASSITVDRWASFGWSVTA